MTTAKKSAVKAIATAFAIALSASMAYTAMADVTPTAVWDCAISGQELNTTQGGLSISEGYHNSLSNGKIVLAGADNAGSTITLPSGISSVSVLVKYSNFSPFSSKNMTYPPVFASVIDSDNHEIGLFSTNNAAAFLFYWQQRTSGSQALPERTQIDSGIALPSSDSGYFLFSYEVSSGPRLYIGSSPTNLMGAENTTYKFSNRTISSVSLGGATDYTYNDGWPNLVIEKVAIFVGEFYAASDVAAYEFPSEIGMYRSDVSVSKINTDFPDASEIDVCLADGVIVTGDTTFTATKVNFHCEGSFTFLPPTGNTATFDFAAVTGKPIIQYSVQPSVGGNVFTSTSVPSFVTDAAQWTGIIYITGGAEVADFTSNAYGNESSLVRIGTISGWVRAPGNYPFTNSVPVELTGSLTLNNGNSANTDNPNRCAVFKKISGNGTINTDSKADRTVVVIQDASEFIGGLGLNSGKFIVFGEAMPSIQNETVGTIFVMAGAKVTNSGFWWATGGIKVDGELCAPNHKDYFGGGTTITTSDTGIFTLTSTTNGAEGETDDSYARITGTGSLKYEGAGWRALSANDFPTSMTLINEQSGDILLSRAQTYTIGSLAGTKKIQGNYGNGDRYLRVLQSKDTEWQGLITYDYYKRLKGFTIAPGVSTVGTLMLSGKQTQSAALTVESGAKVNLTGTWVGATTVAGTLGGTNTIDGTLTLSDGATLKVDDLAHPLSVSGALTADTGAITVDLPTGTPTGAGAKFLNVTGTITTGAKFTVTVGGEKSPFKVIKVADGLKAVLPGTRIVIR